MSLVSWPPTSLRKSKRPQNQSPATQSMWTNEDDDSWEVRAFEEDTTGNLLGCTWPPRSYTCTFCRREFRSAQALGGHMNVHRRDRAKLHEAPPPSHSPTAAQPILIQTGQDFVGNGLCLVYPLPNPNSILFSNQPPVEYSSPLPPISAHSAATKPTDTAPSSVVSSICHSTNTKPSPSNSNDNKCSSQDLAVGEELDLELRLGRRQSQKTP